jgi:hypothetical protein
MVHAADRDSINGCGCVLFFLSLRQCESATLACFREEWDFLRLGCEMDRYYGPVGVVSCFAAGLEQRLLQSGS